MALPELPGPSGTAPITDQEVFSLVIDPQHKRTVLSDPDKFVAFVQASRSFLGFLPHWTFLDQRTGQMRKLGNVLWPGQRAFVDSMDAERFIYALKARKLGFTTLACAYDAWVWRFRDENARVHLFSRRDDAARELLGAVWYGYSRLPEWMQVPVARKTTHEIVLAVGDEEKLCKAYPADEDTAVEATCMHGHVDEWARMGNPERVWQAIEPTMAGSCHIITTGMGPANYTADFWRAAMSGDNAFKAFFTSALNRPDRDAEWLAQKRKSLPEKVFRQEYAMGWEDALFGGGEFVFDGSDLDICGRKGGGPQEAEPGRRYIKACDVGRHADAAVIVVLDKDTADVVHYERHREKPYPFLQKAIERVHEWYPGKTVIEKNSAGEAVMENCEIPEGQMEGFATTGPSKARIISNLELLVEQHSISYSAADWPQLDAEMRGYQLPDTNVVQDSVMAMAIGASYVSARSHKGRVRRVIRV